VNRIFYAMILIAFFVAGYEHIFWEAPPPVDGEVAKAPLDVLSEGLFSGVRSAVDLSFSLIGAMAFFLGLTKIAEVGGLMSKIAWLIRPLMVRLFPDVPPNHPAMGAMILNFSANALGLGNAATPFGIRAMQQLDTLNRTRGTATNAMVLFLAINTSAVTLLPTGVIAIRAAFGSEDPAGILPTTLMATLISTTTAIVAAKLYQRMVPSAEDITPEEDFREIEPFEGEDSEAAPAWLSTIALIALVGCVPLAVLYGTSIAPWVVPLFAVGILTWGTFAGIRVYEVFVEGAKEGFQVAVKIIPFLVAILGAVGMLRASGALDAILGVLSPVTMLIGMPAEALPMALLRPLSGSGAYAVMVDILTNPEIGIDSFTGYLVSTLQGSTETTFYVLAVYFGAVHVRRTRHALPAALTADAAGILGAVLACRLLFALS